MAIITQRYTHEYDATHGTMRFVWAVFGLIFAFAILEDIENRLNFPDWLRIVVNLAALLLAPVATIEISKRTFWPDWLPTWRYVRKKLGVSVDKNEAAKLSFLFDGSLGGQWFPLNGMKSIEEPYRKEALFRFANHIAGSYGWNDPFPEYADKPGSASTSQNQSGENPFSSVPDRNKDARLEALRVVGVFNESASWDEIKQSYRRKIMQYHPDRYAKDEPEVLKYAEEMTKKINKAYEFLSSL